MKIILRDDLRFINDFPSKGITFVDICPNLADPKLLKSNFKKLTSLIEERGLGKIDYIVSPEARGFLFGPTIALNFDAGFIPVRKPGKLPDELCTKGTYDKEYGQDVLCLPTSLDYKGKNFLMVDDVYATGGTARIIQKMIESLGGNYLGTACFINLPALNNDEIISVMDISFSDDDISITYNSSKY